ncbi:DUF3012 domain-containing protein [Rhodospirillaceae bacterium KN72]|uniref:DUF3012 domain-containing protein n=1 Tax=Pacificispira spongiicola TaxID=2729598 RepID=A0A7Y0DZU3_9PROT|nr:DUF3012 domain-containing protein [Pacificispira spongiicola]NMM44635.1 DUF3012 domain-containing protein [Pacificispira spongiicola]
MKYVAAAALLASSLLLTACEPEVGSEEWCQDIKERGVENVTAKEAADFTKNCVF